MKCSEVLYGEDICGQRYHVEYGDRKLRVLDCVVTVSCGVCVFCAVVVLTGFVMCRCVYVWVCYVCMCGCVYVWIL